MFPLFNYKIIIIDDKYVWITWGSRGNRQWEPLSRGNSTVLITVKLDDQYVTRAQILLCKFYTARISTYSMKSKLNIESSYFESIEKDQSITISTIVLIKIFTVYLLNVSMIKKH